METQTIAITGPGGIGKSIIADCCKDVRVHTVEPLRFREPRSIEDAVKDCVAERLWDEVLTSLGSPNDSFGPLRCTGFKNKHEIECWWSKGIARFYVRDDKQVLFGFNTKKKRVRLEMYAPTLLSFLERAEKKDKNHNTIFNRASLKIIILNPSKTSILKPKSWAEISKLTKTNCAKRNDSASSIKSRAESVFTEAQAWQKLIKDFGAVEITDWQYPEWIFKDNQKKNDLIEEMIGCLIKEASSKIPDINYFLQEHDCSSNLSDKCQCKICGRYVHNIEIN